MIDRELAAEQAYVDVAYEQLDRARAAAERMTELTESGPGGTFQARYERDVVHDRVAARLAQLQLGDAQSLCFGRIDVDPAPEFGARPSTESADTLAEDPPETFYIGRIAVADQQQNVLVVDWRAPVAEPFYRATFSDPLGVRRRRHFASRGRTLLGLDDEFFGDTVRALDGGDVSGRGALISALEAGRSGRLSDIVGTIQAEQDRVIRSELPGVLVVQGGPGTGKTVVALHRAAYLLYAHRFPLDGQGVLVVGPNRLFLSYIEQVLPSLGEAGVQIAVLADLVPHVRAAGQDRAEVARVKGDLRMCKVLARAVRDRQRPLPRTLIIPIGVERLRLTPDDTADVVAYARRRARGHNFGRRHAETRLWEILATKFRDPVDAETARRRLRRLPEVREALERMWPILTPDELLNDLFSSTALLRHAAGRHLSDAEQRLLKRERVTDPREIVWTFADVPLLDEALELLGPRPRHRDDDAIRTYGHIVVDEAQDLSPMELRTLDRRSLNGSMTIVGDIAQSTAAWNHEDWSSVLAHLPDRRPPRIEELRLGYRVPGPTMKVAARVLKLAAPGLTPPLSVRETGDAPELVVIDPSELDDRLAEFVRREVGRVGSGNVGVITTDEMAVTARRALADAGITVGHSSRGVLDEQVAVVPISMVKGLELDATIVVDPTAILATYRGPQSLYVALTRATKRLTVLGVGSMPEVLRPSANDIVVARTLISDESVAGAAADSMREADRN